jgi:hypothetical protein
MKNNDFIKMRNDTWKKVLFLIIKN